MILAHWLASTVLDQMHLAKTQASFVQSDLGPLSKNRTKSDVRSQIRSSLILAAL